MISTSRAPKSRGAGPWTERKKFLYAFHLVYEVRIYRTRLTGRSNNKCVLLRSYIKWFECPTDSMISMKYLVVWNWLSYPWIKFRIIKNIISVDFSLPSNSYVNKTDVHICIQVRGETFQKNQTRSITLIFTFFYDRQE